MNIFVISNNPVECARCLDDLRLNKMILETGQLLSSAYRRLYPTRIDKEALDELYKDTHLEHPCSKWTRRRYKNFYWLLELFIQLKEERFYRMGKGHKTFNTIYPLVSKDREVWISKINSLTEDDFVNCSPYKDLSVFEGYKRVLCDKWREGKTTPKWTSRGKPDWFVSELCA